MLGTKWTAANEGSAVDTLYEAFWQDSKERGCYIPQLEKQVNHARTNLKLTGAPITKADWKRLESAEFKIGE